MFCMVFDSPWMFQSQKYIICRFFENLAKHLILLKCSYKRYPTTQTRDTGFGYVKLLELEFKGSRKLVDLFVLQ